MVELRIVKGKWEKKNDWWLLELDISRMDGRVHKSANAIVDKVTNETHPHFGKFIVHGPMRSSPNDGVFDNLKEAKAVAVRLLNEYKKDLKTGRVNWWTMERKEVGENVLRH